MKDYKDNISNSDVGVSKYANYLYALYALISFLFELYLYLSLIGNVFNFIPDIEL